MGIVAAAVVLIAFVYFHFISQRIYDDSTVHLKEIYSQVSRSFGAFMERNWGFLDSCDEYLVQAQGDKEAICGFLGREQDYWNFTQFYFLSSEDRTCLTPGGRIMDVPDGAEWDQLYPDSEPIMAGGDEDITVFAAPVQPGSFAGYNYDAIAVSYNNADLAEALNVTAFSGNGRCFIISNDGSVLLSTLTGGNVFTNYLTYLSAASDLTDEELSQIEADWQDGTDNVLRCTIGGLDCFILYQPLGYQDYTLLSAVPRSAVSAGFLSVQKATITVGALVFSLVGALIVTMLILRSRQISRQNRTELQYRERMFDVLSNSVDDIFLMLDSARFQVDYISPNIQRLLGLDPRDVQINIRVLERCTVSHKVIIPREELDAIPLNGSRDWDYEYMHQTTGERRYYRMRVYRMDIQNTEKFIMVLSDRTQERQMNQHLQEALDAAQSANEAKSNFLSNMSHDIRTPMNAIVGFAMLLQREADDPEKVREYTGKITASSHHLLSLINDVLDMSKIESGKTSLNVDRFSLPELLEDLNIILTPQAKAKNQTFRIHVHGTPPEQIMGDKLRLNQILINLMSNAVKYTPDGGHIDFSVTDLPAAPQYVKLRFTVEDDGIGMSEEFQKHVFDAFSREESDLISQIQGTGLGMAITKNLVDLMGGIIKVESVPGQGSTFTVELSFLLPEQEAAATWFRDKVTRMLVADDEEEVCRVIQELMRDTGVAVSYVTDGAAAVAEAVRAYRDGHAYNVILLDWKMPDLDGVDAARAIQDQIGEHVPIMVLTGYDWGEIEDEAKTAGIDAFMPKPFFVSTFWQAIKPMFPDQAEDKDDKPGAGDSVMNGLLFLVAEDNALNAEILTELLDIEGAKCDLAPNGQKAVELFEASRPGQYDMVLMDVQMPVMNGYEATRAIRASSHPDARTIPIVAMTANTFAEDVRNAMDAGMDDHLGKPIDMDAMRRTIGQLMAAKRELKKTTTDARTAAK